MKRNIISGLSKVDWSDGERQNEFVNSVISALGVFGETLNYDYVCAVSGCAFRTSFSYQGWNHGNYHVINVPDIIEHTFKMLGYNVTHHVRNDYEVDKQLICDSINSGVPVITLEGVINCADACVIAGYDDNGDVLLGWSPFMYISDDHNEPHDETGYFRKSGWHDGFSAGGSQLRIITIDKKCEKLSQKQILSETLKFAKYLIETENINIGQHNGLAAHKAFADALMTYEWKDNFDPYLNVMCNFMQYTDRRYAAKYLSENGRDDLAAYFIKITELCSVMGEQIPQNFTASDLFSDKSKLRPFAESLLAVRDLETEFAARI